MRLGAIDFAGIAFRLFEDPGVEVIGDEEQHVHALLGTRRPCANENQADEADLQELVGHVHKVGVAADYSLPLPGGFQDGLSFWKVG